MGKKLIIRGANFSNYVENEVFISEKTITEFEFISSLGSAIGGMSTIGSPSFGSLADANNQYGIMVPIDIEGIVRAKLYNTYGQSSGIHAKILDVDGNLVKDIIGSTVGVDTEILVEDFPLSSKWMFCNFINPHIPKLEITGYFHDSIKEELDYNIEKENAFMDDKGIVSDSTLIAGRGIVQIPVTSGDKILVVGVMASSGGQNYNYGCFFDSSNNIIKSEILDTTVLPSNNPSYGIISTTVPSNATILKCNVNTIAGFKAYRIL